MQKKTFYTELAYLIGVMLLTLGTAMMAAAGLGLSMVIAPAYLLHLKVSQVLPFFSFGLADYSLQVVLLAACLCGPPAQAQGAVRQVTGRKQQAFSRRDLRHSGASHGSGAALLLGDDPVVGVSTDFIKGRAPIGRCAPFFTAILTNPLPQQRPRRSSPGRCARRWWGRDSAHSPRPRQPPSPEAARPWF